MKPWNYDPAHDLGLSTPERMKSLKRESGLVETGARLAWWAGVRRYLQSRHSFTIEGAEHLPSSVPFVMVANHSSHLDALCLGAPLPWQLRDRVFPIAAGDTFFESVGTSLFAAGLLNALPMWRRKAGSRALHEMRERLVGEPCGFILFPEGTRTRDGQMGEFKAGLGMLIAGTNVPVVPCYLCGAFEAWPHDQKRPRRGKLTLRVGAPLVFEGVMDEREGWERVARETQTAVENLKL